MTVESRIWAQIWETYSRLITCTKICFYNSSLLLINTPSGALVSFILNTKKFLISTAYWNPVMKLRMVLRIVPRTAFVLFFCNLMRKLSAFVLAETSFHLSMGICLKYLIRVFNFSLTTAYLALRWMITA